MTRIFRISGLGLLLLTGCQSGLDRTTGLPAYMASTEYQSRPLASGSLFATDEAVLSGASIEQILNSRVVIPNPARLAVLEFGAHSFPSGWSDELARLREELERDSLRTLRRSQRLVDVSLLPGLMVPEKNTIPYLREAAARYQANLLLVYRTTGRTYDRLKIIGPDEVKAKSVVEAVLLDVRTGIVPFASVSTQTHIGKKAKEDYGFSETIAKAELRATALALEDIAADLVKFLDGVP